MWFILILLSGVAATQQPCVGRDCHPLKKTETSRLPLWTRGYPKPVVQMEPATEKVVTKGTTVLLQCNAVAPADSRVRFLWKKGRRTIDLPMSKNHVSDVTSRVLNDSTISDLTEFTQVLYLVDIEDADQGDYKCVVNNTHGTGSSKKVHIVVQVAPTFTLTPTNVTIKAGSTARLECAAIGTPTPEISWTKDGGDNFPAASERRMHVMPSENTFYITNVKVEDMGVYSCRAKNPAAEVVANVSLTVLQYPQFLRQMTDTVSFVGETARLECSASASPKPILTWTRDRLPLHMTERHFLTADSQLLIIVKTNVDDSGVYTCQISNELGSINQSMSLSVKPPRSTFLPFAVDWLLVLTITMGLVCMGVAGLLVYLWTSSPYTDYTKEERLKQEQKTGDVVTGQTDLSPTAMSGQTDLSPTAMSGQTDLSPTPDVAFDGKCVNDQFVNPIYR